MLQNDYVSYRKWLKLNEYKESRYVSPNIKISVVMPTYNSNPWYLFCAIRSVLKQSYSNWELCIVDDASINKSTRLILKYFRKNHKIHVKFRKTNGHISLATNDAIFNATGDYIAFLDHDDCLAQNALAEIASTINTCSNAKIIYSDEDKITALGVRCQPHFKPDFNYEYLLSVNYICHLLVVKTELVRQVGGLRAKFEGAQDYDLLLRLLSLVEANQIKHIPKILYHWRKHRHSTASSTKKNKSYASINGKKALQDYINNNAIQATAVNGQLPTTYRVKYTLPESLPLVSIIVPSRDNIFFLDKCISSILSKTTYPNYEVIIINNNSTQLKTLQYLENINKKEKINVYNYNDRFNFSAINNFAVKQSKGDIICLMNDDVEVISTNWLEEMVSYSLSEKNGCVGAKLYYPNNTIQHAGIILGIGGVAGHSHKSLPKKSSGYFFRLKLTQNISAVTAACLLVRKEIYMEAKGLDDINLEIAFNDVDFCLKVRALGYNNIWTPYAELYHHESVSRGREDSPEKKKRFKKERDFMRKKWGNNLQDDPFYNPNLSRSKENFSINITKK